MIQNVRKPENSENSGRQINRNPDSDIGIFRGSEYFEFSDNRKHRGGFTLVELLVSMGILLVIYAISTIGLSTVIPSTSLGTSYDLLISDLRLQQTRAMSTSSYFGIHFDTNSYTLFEGITYQAGLSSNYTVELDPTVYISDAAFTDDQVVFSPGSGDVVGYVPGSDSISLSNNQTNKTTIVKLNVNGATYE